jgi:hypothetical protein
MFYCMAGLCPIQRFWSMMSHSRQQWRMLFANQSDDLYREVCERSMHAALRLGTGLDVSKGFVEIVYITYVLTCTPEMNRHVDDSIKAAPTFGFT